MTTKRGEPMVFLRLDDVTGGIDCVVFAATYANAQELCVVDRILIVKGRVDHKEGETKLVVQEISAFESVAVKREVRLRIDATAGARRDDPRPRALFRDYPGESPVLRRLRHLAGHPDARLGPAVPRHSPIRTSTPRCRALLGEVGARLSRARSLGRRCAELHGVDCAGKPLVSEARLRLHKSCTYRGY